MTRFSVARRDRRDLPGQAQMGEIVWHPDQPVSEQVRTACTVYCCLEMFRCNDDTLIKKSCFVKALDNMSQSSLIEHYQLSRSVFDLRTRIHTFTRASCTCPAKGLHHERLELCFGQFHLQTSRIPLHLGLNMFTHCTGGIIPPVQHEIHNCWRDQLHFL